MSGRAVEQQGLLRPAISFIAILLFLTGLGYPALGAAIAPYVAELTDPGGPGGSIVAGPNGTTSSAFIGENITCTGYSNVTSCPWKGLFWSRPSLTDYQPFGGSGNGDPYGPTDPRLVKEIWSYLNKTGPFNVTTFAADCGIPLDIVAPSASGLDPDISVCAALVQIPRIAQFDHLSQGKLLELVNGHVESSGIPYVGAKFVNVVGVDGALIVMSGYAIPGRG